MDTVFHYNPQKNVISPREEKTEEEEPYMDGIEIDESAAPEELDEFETLEDDKLSFAENDFETL
jgi:hypothetical protein